MKNTHFYDALRSTSIDGLSETARANGYPSAGIGIGSYGRNNNRAFGKTRRSAAGRIQRRTRTGERCSGSRHLQRASGSPSNAANTGGLEKQPGIRDDHGAKGKVLSQLIRSFYHGQDSLSLRDTAWGDRDLPGMAFEVFRSLLGSEDLEREAETPLEWFRTWFIWAFGHIHEADAEGLQAQYPASYAAIYSLMDHHDTWENSVTANLDRVGQYDFDLYAARDQIVSYIRKNEEIWPFSYTLILRASSAPYGAERQTPGDPNLYVDFIWWRVCDGGLREYFVVQELTLNPETGESSVWTVPRKDGEMELHNIPDWVVDTLFDD